MALREVEAEKFRRQIGRNTLIAGTGRAMVNNYLQEKKIPGVVLSGRTEQKREEKKKKKKKRMN